MFEQSLEELDAEGTLGFLRDRRAAADREEALLLLGVGHYLDLHPEAPDPDDWWLEEIGAEREIPLAGAGTPLVAEFALADLAAQLRLTEGAARSLAGDVLELRHRLPRVWERVVAPGRGLPLPGWKARKIAAETRHLSPKAVAWLDQRVAPVAHKVGYTRLMRLIAAAVLACDPPAAGDPTQPADERPDGRRAEVTPIGPDGRCGVWAEIDGPDGRALDAVLAAGADALAALGDTTSLDVRRAKMLGLLADPHAALALLQGHEPQRKRSVNVSLHLDALDVIGERGTAHLDNQLAVAVQVLTKWCATAGTQVNVLPVIDTRSDLVTGGYQPTETQRQQVFLRDPCCVFPWCDKPGANHDLDHIVEYDDTGPPDQTRSSNLARLCRFHHRLKTHTAWTYRRLPDGTYHWTSPTGGTWIVDPHGTTEHPAA